MASSKPVIEFDILPAEIIFENGVEKLQFRIVLNTGKPSALDENSLLVATITILTKKSKSA